MLKPCSLPLARTGAALALSTLCASAHAFGLGMAAPPGAEVSEIATALRINGLSTRVRSFQVASPLAAVEQHYRDILGDTVVREQIAGWTVLARVQGRRLDTVRLRHAGPGTTEGTLSSAELGTNRTPGARRDFAAPSGSARQLELEMRDQGRDSRFLVWQGGRSIDASARQLASALGARGLQLERSLPLQDGHARGRKLWFRGNGSEATAVIVEQDRAVSVSLALTGSAAGSTP